MSVQPYSLTIDSIDYIIRKNEYSEKDGKKTPRMHYRIVDIHGEQFDITSSFDNPQKEIVQCITEHWPHIEIREETEKKPGSDEPSAEEGTFYV
ncbi:MAG: hypothetical protein Q3M24_15160 [Candidatus Electrothrix aestuarii]|uniref:Uncharacterized protein n=1 Tax=Candidatus Electrothrix aestuarii TaxID=3062594 RepID=A0AAU8LR26_9BACT|nr:hypothetical protein [Candidatus Electrothrix aestuarii]